MSAQQQQQQQQIVAVTRLGKPPLPPSGQVLFTQENQRIQNSQPLKQNPALPLLMTGAGLRQQLITPSAASMTSLSITSSSAAIDSLKRSAGGSGLIKVKKKNDLKKTSLSPACRHNGVARAQCNAESQRSGMLLLC